MAQQVVLPQSRGVVSRRRWLRPESRTELLVIVLLSAICLAVCYPFAWLIFSSFKTGADIVRIPIRLLPEEWTLGAYQMVLNPERANLPRAYLNSFLVTAGTVVTVLFTSSLGGFVFARLDFPGRRVLFYFILSTTMVPFLTLLIPLYIVMKNLALLDTLWGLWVPAIFSSFGIFLSRQFIYGIPGELYDAAKIDGSSDFGIYRRIILPLTRPLLSVLAIFTFLGSFNAYLWPLVILTDRDKMTLPLVLSRIADRFGAQDYQAVMAGGVLISLPPLLVFLLFQRNFVRGIALTGLKG
jgi:multiple sugar transport system permease protein